jgi:signal transduction histidine kinase
VPDLSAPAAWVRRSRRPAIRDWAARTLLLNATVAGGIVLVCVLIWGVTGGGTFWPGWVLFGFVTALALQLAVARILAIEDGRTRWFMLDIAVLSADCVLVVALWAGTGMGTFWPIWVILGSLVWLALHAIAAYRDRLLPSEDHRGLQLRIEQLTRTRAGAVDAQATELNRIERDLHDGAQARLVALTMSLGLARAHLDDDPERARELLDESSDQARLAIRELRDLARGIAPPILMDRGLEAAIRALPAAGAVPITVHAGATGPVPEAVERAAYFVVAEAVTNAAKHGHPSTIEVDLDRTPDALAVRVSDDGGGGADPQGAGLAGLRQRTEALDGELTVRSAAGGPTIVEARFPCAS